MKKRFLRSYTIFTQSTKPKSKINILRTKLNSKKELVNIKKLKRGSRHSINLDIPSNEKILNNQNKKLNSGINLIRMDLLIENISEKQSIEDRFEKSIKNLSELISMRNSKNDSREEGSLIFALKHSDKRGFYMETNKLIEIVKYILRKKNKTERDLLIIKSYFSRIDKISTLFLSLNSENIFIKLLAQLKFEEFKENTVICKEGDKGEKLFIILKGSTYVLIQKEGKDGICTQFEYIKYLIVLYLYQEIGMFNKILFYNKSIIKVKEAGILTLLMVFRFFKFYKDQEFFLTEKGLAYDEDNVCDFINNENSVKEYIYKKLDFLVEDAVHLFGYSQMVIKELYRFYERKISQLSISQEKEKDEESSSNNVPNRNIFIHPSNFDELNMYGENIKAKYKTKNKRTRKKLREEIFNKIYEIKEIPKEIIYNTSPNDYLSKLNFGLILQEIRSDYILNGDKFFRLKEDKKTIKFLNYLLVNTISQFQMFGELALNSMNRKRTATIITKDHCYFGVLDKKVYDSFLKVAQIKSRIWNILYFTEGPIFKGFSPTIFLNEFFYYLNKLSIPKGKILFNKGEIRSKIYFVEKGQLELGCNMTLAQIGETMKQLGGISDNKKEKYLCDLFYEFKYLYENKKMNFKICILDNNYIIGLDDMCLDNKYLFDCKCVSTEGADVYEFDYFRYEKALNEYKLIFNNNVEYVNQRRENFIKILFEQRNSLVDFEFAKIKEENFYNDKMKEKNYTKKNNMMGSLFKDVKYNKKQLINLTQYKQYKYLNKSKEDIINNINTTNSTSDKKHKNNSHDINIKRFPSMKIVLMDDNSKLKLSEADSKNNYSKRKTLNDFYPKLNSDKNIKFNFSNLKTINKYFENEYQKEIKNKKKKINPFKSLENNKYNYDFTDSNLIFNDNNKIMKSFNININNQSTSIEKRRKRNIIPITTNYKLSLNKNRNKITKTKIYKMPPLFKECSKEYSSIKTKSKEKRDNNTLFSDYQKNVYNIFYPRHCKKLFDEKENESDDKFLVNLTENNKSNRDKKKLGEQKKDKSVYVNLERNNFRNKNDINFFDVNIGKNNRGIIDCLCFDNWAEKRIFEKNLLNYKIS